MMIIICDEIIEIAFVNTDGIFQMLNLIVEYLGNSLIIVVHNIILETRCTIKM